MDYHIQHDNEARSSGHRQSTGFHRLLWKGVSQHVPDECPQSNNIYLEIIYKLAWIYFL